MFTGVSPFKAKTEYLIFQNILNLNYTFDNVIPDDAQDLIKRILKIDPKERMLIQDIKKHPFFDNFNTTNYMEKLKNFYKPLFDVRHHSDCQVASKSVKTQSTNLLNNDVMIKAGILKKRSPWFYYDKRKLILYSTPRIDYIEPDSNALKGTILLNKKCRAELVEKCKFDLVTPNRTYTFMCKKKFDITPWVDMINDTIAKYSL